MKKPISSITNCTFYCWIALVIWPVFLYFLSILASYSEKSSPQRNYRQFTTNHLGNQHNAYNEAILKCPEFSESFQPTKQVPRTIPSYSTYLLLCNSSLKIKKSEGLQRTMESMEEWITDYSDPKNLSPLTYTKLLTICLFCVPTI